MLRMHLFIEPCQADLTNHRAKVPLNHSPSYHRVLKTGVYSDQHANSRELDGANNHQMGLFQPLA